ncbi:hypothetical protein HKD42_06585 [Altererythrobacter sp. RZ02]|uniref:Cyclodeaminase/cyclohydrolase domain-containing protein n=1 Tax=Pontixanthobacter rizhaonensis TaxID=2730337 RepID=A0A848QGJ0_9SPHN|nr:cyclodeaminase/cyclohydrolase family protein [Pontixanthobacter rizhaonensis]NMW31722.1 hypothetical protein [Pontixanthobacter rizhaonensis]
MKQPALPLAKSQSLITLPADELLDEFGSGGHSPGSGSAAALMALLSAQLSATVYKIAIRKNHGDTSQFSYLLRQLEGVVLPRLKTLFQEDAEKFDEVIRVRTARDLETDLTLKRRLRARALTLLQEATEIVMEIIEICKQLIDFGIIAFDSGMNRVRGDSGSAISVAISGAMSGLFILNLNLNSFAGGKWANQQRERLEEAQRTILEKQADALRRIARLRPDESSSTQPSFF